MEKRISKIIISFLISIQLFSLNTKACGWYEYDDTYRISMFRAEIPELLAFRPFYYTPDFWNNSFPYIVNSDWEKNCQEWQSEIGKNVDLRDIYSILYKINPDVFFLAYDDGNLKESFEDNTFIEFLLLPKNKEWLDYLVFAKRNEYNNQFLDNPWGDSYNTDFGHITFELIPEAEKLIAKTKNDNIRNRYVYQLIRLYRQTDNNQKCIDLYDKYFKGLSKPTAIQNWALLHKAESLGALGKKLEANYLYSVVFNQCDEKKMRSYQFFSKKLVEQSISLAKNKQEIAGIWALSAIQNPGPALDEIKKVVENYPNQSSLALLIMREVNKLEDWIFTPELTNHSSSLEYGNHVKEWDENYDSIKVINKRKDLEYLNEFKLFLANIKKKANSNLHDYITLAEAHLCLIAKENTKALELFSQISKNASPAILLQKNTELILFYSLENEILKDEIKEKLAATFIELEKLGLNNASYLKQIHSLCELVSRAYSRNGDIATASLLKTLAERYKQEFEQKKTNGYWGNYHLNGYYWQIAYLDRFASPADIDRLLLLTEKNKTSFEKFLLEQPVASKNALLDLKGTLALRIGDFKTAQKAFLSVPHDYWQKTYDFNQYLKYDPFVAPNLPIDTNYVFNKADVLMKVVELQEESDKNANKKAENYIKIGNFLYNSSYWGNSWMMLSYSWTTNPAYESSGYGYYDILFGKINDYAANYEENFFECKLALNYYFEAEKSTKDKELLAMITFMKHCCSYNNFNWQQMKRGWDAKPEVYTPVYVADFYTKYQNTKTFEQVHCMLMDDFAMNLGLY